MVIDDCDDDFVMSSSDTKIKVAEEPRLRTQFGDAKNV
jgi:hypothetical protein